MADKKKEETKIHRLDPTVINRIAAGEVIQRPFHAVKELIENSIDAGSTSISVTAKGGGLKSLLIQDDGCGIGYNDLFIVCERFTTSKLQNFEDLSNMQTFGFRGEALASISHIAHVTITSKTATQKCAFKAKFMDGVLIGPGKVPGSKEGKPVPGAGVKGTSILIEDLFFNVLTRKNALKNPSDEYNRILTVMTRYALQNPKIAFSCKKQGGNNDIQTPKNSDTQTVVRMLFGTEIAKSLLSFNLKSGEELYNTSLESVGFEAQGWISSPNYHRKKGEFILFINKRLVENSSIKKGIENVYQNYLPKHTHPFIYITLSVDPQHIDVNVHPTKNEVHFIKEAEIVENLQKAVEAQLLGPSTTRSFSTNLDLSTVLKTRTKSTPSASSISAPKGEEEVYQFQKVRRDFKERTLEQFMADSSSKKATQIVGLNGEEDEEEGGPDKKRRKTDLSLKDTLQQHYGGGGGGEKQQPPVTLTSVRNLISNCETYKHADLTKIFKGHVFVGSATSTYSLIQHATKLYVVDVPEMSKELLYQRALRSFSHFSPFKLDPPVPMTRILAASLLARKKELERQRRKEEERKEKESKRSIGDAPIELRDSEENNFEEEGGRRKSGLESLPWLEEFLFPEEEEGKGKENEKEGETEKTVEDLAQNFANFLIEKREMLAEYFQLCFSEEGELLALPVLLPSLSPLLEHLPCFLMRLVREVDWDEEEACFEGVARELARYYCVKPGLDLSMPMGKMSSTSSPSTSSPSSSSSSSSSSSPSSTTTTTTTTANTLKWVIEHSLFSSSRSFCAPEWFVGRGVVMEVACLENMYKIFERC